MAIISSHILNSVDGSHAAGVKVQLINLASGETVFETQTDDGGRLKQNIADPDPKAEYELAYEMGAYWAASGTPTRLTQIVLRFGMPQPDKTYHSPIIISPNGYSGWVSA